MTPPDVEGDTAIIVAFSGGGTRAAAFAHGVMLGLDRLPAGNGGTYFDKVIGYSGVSGGSVAAAYYGLKGRNALRSFRELFLLKNAEEALATDFNLINLGRGFQGGVNDASRLSRWLDQNLFEGAPLSMMFRPGKPVVWINASDLRNGTSFLFDPMTFAALCSDIERFPLSLAVAASSAVPVAFVPIVLANYPDSCRTSLPLWVDRVLADPSAGGQAKAAALAFKRYRDPSDTRFVKLVDGGLTDNFGLTGLVVARSAEKAGYAPLSPQSMMHLRRVLFIVVNSARGSNSEFGRTVEGPSGRALLQALSDTAIDSSVHSGYDAFRLTVREWESAARNWRCDQFRGRRPSGLACDDLTFSIVPISFDQIPDKAAALYAVPTRFSLPAEQVDLVIGAGVTAVVSNPEIQEALSRQRR